MILTEYNEKEHLKNVANYNKEQGRQQVNKASNRVVASKMRAISTR